MLFEVTLGYRQARARDARVLTVPPAKLHNGEEPSQQPRPARVPQILPLVYDSHSPQGNPLTLIPP